MAVTLHYHDFVISVNFAKTLKFQDRRGFTSLASGSFHSRITGTHWYASRISRTSPQSALLRRPCAGVSSGSVSSKSSGLYRLSMGFSSARRPVSYGTSLSTVRYTLDFLSRARPSSPVCSTASPTAESSTMVGQVHRGGSNPLSSL